MPSKLNVVLVFVLMGIFLSYSKGYAVQFSIDYFNGVKWGSKLPQKGFKSEYTDNSLKLYSRASDKSRIEGIPVEEITYTLSNGKRFDAAHFLFHGNDNYQKVRALCIKIFGNSKSIQGRLETFQIAQGSKYVIAMLQFDGNKGMVNFKCEPTRK